MASSKGGSGKTVITATFGAFLSGIGKRVLMVDTDAATNGLTLLHLKEVLTAGEIAIGQKREPRGTYELRPYDAKPEVVILPNGTHLVPALYNFANTEERPLEVYAETLREMLQKLRGDYDYIILDAQAGSDWFARVAMSREISDEVVIVSEYDPMSAAGVERLKALFRDDLNYTRTWILLNKMLPEFVKSFSDFLSVVKYLSPIPWNAEVVRAYARRGLALDMQNGSEYTLAIMQSLSGLLGDEVSKEITDWANERSASIREPIAVKLRDTELELAGLDALETEGQLKKWRMLMLLAYSFLGPLMLAVIIEQVYRLITGNTDDRNPIFVLIFIFAPLLGALTYFVLQRGKASEILLGIPFEERTKIRIQRVALEAKLVRLQSLKDAGLDTLLKSKDQV